MLSLNTCCVEELLSKDVRLYNLSNDTDVSDEYAEIVQHMLKLPAE
jgi:hypothetical protein